MSGGRRVGSWELEDPIGQGSFATVWRARHFQSGKMAAVKEINTDKLNKKLQESLSSEISVLQKVQHRNIVGFLDLMQEPGYIYLVMEFCGGGDLSHYLRHYKRVSEDTARYFMLQLADGLRELRHHNFIHRDLKPQNLLLSDVSKQPLLKIADFGFARDLLPTNMAETLCGSPLYMAPEILQYQKYDAKADLWSVGTILFELLVGKPPFSGANHIDLLRNIQGNQVKIPESISVQLSAPCQQLVHALLRRNPLQRISPEEFFNHEWFQPVISAHQSMQMGQAESSQEACGMQSNGDSDGKGGAGCTVAPKQLLTPKFNHYPTEPQQHQQHPQQRQRQILIQATVGSPHPTQSSPVSPAPAPAPAPTPTPAPKDPLDLTHSQASLNSSASFTAHGRLSAAAVDSVTGIFARELNTRSPSPRFSVFLTPEQTGADQPASSAGMPNSSTPESAKKMQREDSFDFDYVVVSPSSSSHAAELAPQKVQWQRQQQPSGVDATRFFSESRLPKPASSGLPQHVFPSQSPMPPPPAPSALSHSPPLGSPSFGSSPPVGSPLKEAPSMDMVVRLPESINTLDLLQRVIMVLMQSARSRLDALANANAAAGPLGTGGSANSGSSSDKKVEIEAAVVAAGATQPELVGLYLYCSQLLEQALLGGSPEQRSSNEEAFMLLSSHARSLTSAIEDRLLTHQRDPKQLHTPVPCGTDMVYDSALRYSRAAAVDELMSQHASSIDQYAKAADLLLFLLVDVPAVADIKPKLGAAEEQRIYKYYAAVKMRQSMCMAAYNSA